MNDQHLDQKHGALTPEGATKPAISSRPAPQKPAPKTVTIEFTDAQYAAFRDKIAPIQQADEAVAKLFVEAFVGGPPEAIHWLRARHTGPAVHRPVTPTVFAHLDEIAAAKFTRENRPSLDLAEAVTAFISATTGKR